MPTKNIVLTTDAKLKNSPEFKKLEKHLQEFYNIGLVDRLAGNCVSAAELITNSCLQMDIPAKMVECQLTTMRETDDGTNEFTFIGFDNLNYQGQIDTHMICVTQGETPLMIDLSIAHLLPGNHPIVVEKLTDLDPEKIADFTIGEVKLTYTPKKIVRYPSIHQKNMLERLQDEEKLKKEFKFFKYLVLIGLGIGAVNILANLSIIGMRLLGVGA